MCEQEDYKEDDLNCWTGDSVGDYRQTVMSVGVDAQRYNPEVPLSTNAYNKATKVTELVDKLIKLRQTVANAVSIFGWIEF